MKFFPFNDFIRRYRTFISSWIVSIAMVVRINILWWLGCRFYLKCIGIMGERYSLKRLFTWNRQFHVEKIGLRAFRRCASVFANPVCNESTMSLIYSCLFVRREKKRVRRGECVHRNISFKSFPKTGTDAGCVCTDRLRLVLRLIIVYNSRLSILSSKNAIRIEVELFNVYFFFQIFDYSKQ